jgi:hypothetical protein
MISKSIFNRYKFRYEYAEDLDLGIRLIQDGHTLGLMGTTQVIHSHNRSAFYFLKRGFTEAISLKQIVPGMAVPDVTEKYLVTSIAISICCIRHFAASINDRIWKNTTIKELEIYLENAFKQNTNVVLNNYLLKSNNIEGRSLAEFIQVIRQFYVDYPENIDDEHDTWPCKMAFDILSFSKQMLHFQADNNAFVDESMKSEILQSVYKGFGWLAGVNIGYYSVNNSRANSELWQFVQQLRSDI